MPEAIRLVYNEITNRDGCLRSFSDGCRSFLIHLKHTGMPPDMQLQTCKSIAKD